MRPDNKGVFVGHASCDKCGSSDAVGVYEDHEYCYSCQSYNPNAQSSSQTNGSGQAQIQNQNQAKQKSLLKGEPKALEARGLTEADCAKFAYWVGKNAKGETVQIANYRDTSGCLLYTSPSPRDRSISRMPSSA